MIYNAVLELFAKVHVDLGSPQQVNTPNSRQAYSIDKYYN